MITVVTDTKIIMKATEWTTEHSCYSVLEIKHSFYTALFDTFLKLDANKSRQVFISSCISLLYCILTTENFFPYVNTICLIFNSSLFFMYSFYLNIASRTMLRYSAIFLWGMTLPLIVNDSWYLTFLLMKMIWTDFCSFNFILQIFAFW